MVFPLAITILIVRGWSELNAGELGGTQVGDSAGEDDGALGLLTADGLGLC
jgi:hypothetical protein